MIIYTTLQLWQLLFSARLEGRGLQFAQYMGFIEIMVEVAFVVWLVALLIITRMDKDK